MFVIADAPWLRSKDAVADEVKAAGSPVRTLHGRGCYLFANMARVNVINRKNLMTAASRHPETPASVENWFMVARRMSWSSLSEVRKTYRTVDQVGRVLVFNIAGGNYRLITVVSWESQRLYFKALYTHAEYERIDWRGKWAL